MKKLSKAFIECKNIDDRDNLLSFLEKIGYKIYNSKNTELFIIINKGIADVVSSYYIHDIKHNFIDCNKYGPTNNRAIILFKFLSLYDNTTNIGQFVRFPDVGTNPEPSSRPIFMRSKRYDKDSWYHPFPDGFHKEITFEKPKSFEIATSMRYYKTNFSKDNLTDYMGWIQDIFTI